MIRRSAGLGDRRRRGSPQDSLCRRFGKNRAWRTDTVQRSAPDGAGDRREISFSRRNGTSECLAQLGSPRAFPAEERTKMSCTLDRRSAFEEVESPIPDRTPNASSLR